MVGARVELSQRDWAWRLAPELWVCGGRRMAAEPSDRAAVGAERVGERRVGTFDRGRRERDGERPVEVAVPRASRFRRRTPGGTGTRLARSLPAGWSRSAQRTHARATAWRPPFRDLSWRDADVDVAVGGEANDGSGRGSGVGGVVELLAIRAGVGVAVADSAARRQARVRRTAREAFDVGCGRWCFMSRKGRRGPRLVRARPRRPGSGRGCSCAASVWVWSPLVRGAVRNSMLPTTS